VQAEHRASANMIATCAEAAFNSAARSRSRDDGSRHPLTGTIGTYWRRTALTSGRERIAADPGVPR
jgi:hypothetical protein